MQPPGVSLAPCWLTASAAGLLVPVSLHYETRVKDVLSTF